MSRAIRERVSLTRLVDRTLRAGLRAERQPAKRKRPYREQTHPMDAPLGLDKALTLAARLEDEENLRRIALRKMKVIDLNVLLYPVNVNAPYHSRVCQWWERAINSDESVGFIYPQ
jgi:hypothetical protein